MSGVDAAGGWKTAGRPRPGPHAPVRPWHGRSPCASAGVLVYKNDREALNSFLDAWQQASELTDKAFGVVLPPPSYKPGPRR